MNFIKRIFKNKEVEKLEKQAEKIMELEKEYSCLKDEDFKNITRDFKRRLENGESLEKILPEAFAACREAAWRTIGLKHYKVQIIGGIALHQGRIAEMKTGEGKTLAATLPAYLNAIAGDGVHIVTTNEYLAKRDNETMKPIFDLLGISTETLDSKDNELIRKEKYKADILYGTNNEFGFDYLRDNIATNEFYQAQRPLNFVIIDEIDSILIDEAKTPLIITNKSNDVGDENVFKVKKLIDRLNKEDYIYKIEENFVCLNEKGIEKVEKYFGIENYAEPDNFEIQHLIMQGLRAKFTMKNNKDYIVKDNEIVIIDKYTGRLMEGRRFSAGLHQALEAKEDVEVNGENITIASITFQKFFQLYKKLSGMTGTGKGAETEFREIYNIDVICIPTNKPVVRIDREDSVFFTKNEKYIGILHEIISSQKIGQPVLIGTTSIEESEEMANILKENNIHNFNVLNAKNYEREAEIIALAGNKGMITIATNMAGRGTDIKLDDELKDNIGLKVIGVSINESKRVDDQLRGRAGRQGDVGESKFFVSLEDDIVKMIFGEEKIEIFNKEKNKIENKKKSSKNDKEVLNIIHKAIISGQKKLEGMNYEIRKAMLSFDEVISIQREIIYKERNIILKSDNLDDLIENLLQETIEEIFDEIDNEIISEEDADYLLESFRKKCVNRTLVDKNYIIDFEKEKLVEVIKNELIKIRIENKNKLKEIMLGIEKQILINTIDYWWIKNLDDMEEIRNSSRLFSYKQIEPVTEYRLAGSKKFQEIIKNIKKDMMYKIFSFEANITEK